jgi:ubiquinol-cytochrome c reductase cytochrome b subunit
MLNKIMRFEKNYGIWPVNYMMGRFGPNPSALSPIVANHLKRYPTPINLTGFWNFGSLAGICLIIQLLTGVFLVMHYSPTMEHTFHSIEHIMRDVNDGWFLRYAHANGASMFLAVLYIHIGKGLYYKSYLYEFKNTWLTGCLIYLLVMASAFIGYSLVWSSMSFWGATVITNFLGAVPVVGKYVVQWIWGGFSVGAATLNRFFSLHYVLPFIVAFVAIGHLFFLHTVGSSNPYVLENHGFFAMKTNFYPYSVIKDLLGLIVMFMVFTFLIGYAPNYLGHPDSYSEANPLVTPPHIQPEWYFLPFYGILRSIPDKLGGIIAMFGAIFIFFLLPFMHHMVQSFKQVYFFSNQIPQNPSRGFELRFVIVGFLFSFFILLGWLGGQPPEEPMVTMGQISTVVYFVCATLLAFF